MKLDAYEVLDVVGRGGMGVVLRCRAPDGSIVAAKVLHTGTGDATVRARFEREMRLLADLGEGFVPLLATGEKPLVGPYLVMPFLAGGTLADRLAKGPLGVDETVALGIALGRSLGRAHARGIVHRDVKPSNVLFAGPDLENPLVADLGLAKHFRKDVTGASRSASLSGAGEMRGTLHYMAPEQMEDAKSVGPTADVYSLGALLFHCLAGDVPFPGMPDPDAIRAGARSLRETRADVPEWLDRVVLRCLAGDPAARYEDGAALAEALAGKGDATPRRRLALLAIAALVVVAAAVVVVAWKESEVAPTPPDPPAPVATRARERSPLDDARARLDANDLDGALALLDRVVKEQERPIAALLLRSEVHERRGELQAAVDDAAHAIDLAPNDAKAKLRRAEVRRARGDAERAIEDLDGAIRLDERLAKAWALRATLHHERGAAAEAVRDATRALELEPGNVVALRARAQAFVLQREHARAVADATELIRLAPKDSGAWTTRAGARMHLGENDGAIEDATRAIDLAPAGHVFAWVYRALARAEKGQLVDAIADATSAIESFPKLSLPLKLRAELLARKGDREGAARDLERALELAPGEPDAAANRKKIEALRNEAR